MLKYMVLVVDCDAAAFGGQGTQPQTIAEMKARVLHSLGLASKPDGPDAVRAELQFAGYDGPMRLPLKTEAQFSGFLASMATADY